ncbi:hypothetical protein [uncultured Nostoc sp.]|uniref:hypothetical protein n=1 Tax=uncultured Nostoc sp. TaxID=340711 RepID=UPI0035CB2D41
MINQQKQDLTIQSLSLGTINKLDEQELVNYLNNWTNFSTVNQKDTQALPKIGLASFSSVPFGIIYLCLISSCYQAYNLFQEESVTTSETITKPIEKSQINQKPLSSILSYISLLVPWLWAIVIIVVIIPLIGEFFIAKSFQSPIASNNPALVTETKIADWKQVEKALYKGLEDARQGAETYASKELDVWVDDLTEQIDKSFLDWYFGYFNQKEIEYKAFFAGITANAAYWLNPNSQAPEVRIAEIITEDFQTEFAKRVLRPQISQLRLERITTQTAKKYLNEISLNISQYPKNQKIIQADWNRYLNDLSINIVDVEGKMSSLSWKALSGGGAYLMFKPVITPLLPLIGSKIMVKLAGKAGAKIAAKTGAILGGKVTSVFLDSSVGVGIILWDIWDNNHTASIEKPILRRNLVDYLQQVKDSLLTNPENGIMTVVDEMQRNLVQSLSLTESLTSNH